MAPLPELLQLTPEEAVRRIALGLLDEARAAADRLDDDADHEALHAFRVAIRRLRSTARLWRPELGRSLGKKQRRALRGLQTATNSGRDAEVALEWLASQAPLLQESQRPGFAWLVQSLEERRREALKQAREQVRARFAQAEASLRERLPVLTLRVHLEHPDERPRFAEALATRAREAARELAGALGAVASLDDRAATHQARIAGKRLRYLVEPVRGQAPGASAVVRQCRRLQDLLGELNDAHVLCAELGSALELAAAERARRLHELTRLDPAGYRTDRELAGVDLCEGLLELTRRVERRLRRLFARLEREWLESGISRLLEEVETLADRLEDVAQRSVEIERKYLLARLPDLEALRAAGQRIEVLELEQGWLPGQRLRERIRRTRLVRGGEEPGSSGSLHYTRTLKFGSGLVRTELEEPTTQEVFETLWPLTQGCRVRKRRYRVAEPPHLFEIDEFLDRPLWLAEVELTSAEELLELPAWLAALVVREVTDDPGYTNLALAR